MNSAAPCNFASIDKGLNFEVYFLLIPPPATLFITDFVILVIIGIISAATGPATIEPRN